MAGADLEVARVCAALHPLSAQASEADTAAIADKAAICTADAMHDLAAAYETGDGVAADLGLALDWYRRAAALDHPASVNAVGVAYSNGLGVAVDAVEAGRWFVRAAELGNSWGMKNAGDWYSEGRMGGPPDIEKGVYWTRLAAERGLAEAQTRMGYFHLTGTGVAEDAGEALRLFRLGAEGGDPVGMNNYGYMLQIGLAGNAQLELGFQWLLRAAEAGNVDAMENLVDAYRDGKGVAADPGAADLWAERAKQARAG